MDQSFPFDIRPTPPQPGPLDATTIAPPAAAAPAGPGALYVPAAPAGGESQGAAGGQPAGPGALYSPRAPDTSAPAPTTQLGALGAGSASAATFNSVPVIKGLSAASGMQTDRQAPESDTTGEATAYGNIGRAIASPFVGAYELATGAPGASDQYNVAREQAQIRQDQLQQAYPKTYLAGELGTTLATLPFTGGGAGVEGATTLGNVLRSARAGAIGGAGFGAGTAASRGEGPLDVARGAAAGAIAGGALGGGAAGALDVTGALGRSVMSAIRGHSDLDAEAARRIVGNMRADVENEGLQWDPNAIIAAQRAGIPTAIVDSGGERTMALARSSANTSPQGRRALENLSDPRFEQQAHRISGVVRNLTGGSHATLDNAALKSAARKANAPAYKRAYQISERRNPNGIISPKLEELMSSDALPTAMQRAVPLGKDRSVVEGMGPFTPQSDVPERCPESRSHRRRAGSPGFAVLGLYAAGVA